MPYKLLTFLIMLLASLRKHCGKEWVLWQERDEHNLIEGYWISKDCGILIECCDCGLAHRFFENKKGTHALPERPRSYDYKWRLGN